MHPFTHSPIGGPIRLVQSTSRVHGILILISEGSSWSMLSPTPQHPKLALIYCMTQHSATDQMKYIPTPQHPFVPRPLASMLPSSVRNVVNSSPHST